MPKFLYFSPVLLALAVAAAPASTMTAVQPSPYEPDLVQILDNVYGAGNYFRIGDDSDQTWTAGQVSVRALATYAGAVQSLGYCMLCDGSDDIAFDQMFWADGVFSTPLTVQGQSNLAIDSEFRWFDDARLWPTVGKVYSAPSMNPGGADHMVTYGLFGQPNTFVVAVEDWLYTANPQSDKDYQDLIFELTYLRPESSIVTPEPGAFFTLAGGMVVLLCFRRRRANATP